jgi:hypothetical protein
LPGINLVRDVKEFRDDLPYIFSKNAFEEEMVN